MDQAGQRFGRYDVVRPLGAGGMGEILLARQAGLPGVERLVVIKKILPHLARETDFIERFVDETRVAASLTHGNIVQVYEVGQVDGEYFMAMEYVDGMDLKEMMAVLRQEDRRIPEPLALYVLVEVAKALAYAHERRGPDGASMGIVHRDVSPANLLLSRDGQVKLADFGVAKAAARLSLSLPGTLHGKVYYMSPEQVSGGDVDARSDIFSLGVVAYEMLSGQRPFEGPSDVAVIDRVRRCDPVPLGQVAPWIAPSLDALVMRALQARPEDRYPTMEAFGQALTSYLLEAHTIVSARTLADFLGGLSPRPVDRRPPSVASLDDIAAALLEQARASGLPAAADAAPRGTDRIARQPAPAPRVDTGSTRTVAAQAADLPAGVPRTGVRRRVVLLLVLANLLLGAVGALLLTRNRGAGPAAGEDPAAAVVPPDRDARGPDADPAAGEADATVGDTEPDAGPRTGAAADAQADGAAAAADAAAETGGSTPGPATPAPRRVTVRTDPPGAELWAGSRRLGTTPLEVTVPPGGLRVEARHPEHAARAAVLSAEGPGTVTLALPDPPGRVKFRFFPANCEVRIDGEVLATQGNLVDLALPPGRHTVELRSRTDDRTRTESFLVEPGTVRALGTLELEAP